MGTVLSTFSNEDSIHFAASTPRRTLTDVHKAKGIKCYLTSAVHDPPYHYNNPSESLTKKLYLKRNGENSTIYKFYEYNSDKNCADSSRSVNTNMFSLKRLIFPSLSRKTKISDTNGIIKNLQIPNDRLQRLSVKSNGHDVVGCGGGSQREFLGNSTSYSNIEIPVYYYQQQQCEKDSVKLNSDLRSTKLETNRLNLASSSSYCDSSNSKVIHQIRTSGTTQNSCCFRSSDIASDDFNQGYHSTGQQSLTDFSSIYQKDPVLPQDVSRQRRQLSEPNSQLKHRHSHCLSTDFSQKCCPTDRIHKNSNITSNLSITDSNIVSHTPSLIDLSWATKYGSSHPKGSKELLYLSNSPYSYMANNFIVQSNQSNNSSYMPTSFIPGIISTHIQKIDDKTSPTDPPYSSHYHQLHPVHPNYHHYRNNQPFRDHVSWDSDNTSPGASSCLYDMHFPTHNSHENQTDKLKFSLSTDKEHFASLPVHPFPLTLPSNNNSNNSKSLNASSVQNFSSPQRNEISNINKNNMNDQHYNYQTKVNESDVKLSTKFGRRLTEFGTNLICPLSPVHVQRRVGVVGFDKYRNFTKSISCYALKLFTHHNNQNSCQDKYKKDSVDTTATTTKKSFRINDINYDRKMFKLRSYRKPTDRANRTNINKDFEGLKQHNHQVGEVNTNPVMTTSMTTTSLTKPTDTTNNNHSNLISKYYRNHVQSTDRTQCFQHRKNLGKLGGIYGLFENLKADQNLDKYHNSLNYQDSRNDARFYCDGSGMQTTWRRCDSHQERQSKEKPVSKPSIITSTTAPNAYNLFRQPIFKASTGELLKCLSFFIVARVQVNLAKNSNRLRNSNLRGIQPAIIVAWIRAIDRALLLQGWSEVAFINPTHIVFLYMMLKNFIENDDVYTERELHTIIMASLYLAYSYIGNEISYPLRPFLIAEANQLMAHSEGGNKKSLTNTENTLKITPTTIENCLKSKIIDEVRNRFWQYVMRIINEKSSEMLRINADPLLFMRMFQELTSYENIVTAMKLSSNRNHNNDKSRNDT